MIALYYPTSNVEPIELFIELADVELVQNVTLLNQQYEVHDPYIEVPRMSIDRQSSVHSEEVLGNDDGLNHQKVEFSDPKLDEVLNDIDNKGKSHDDNVDAPLIRNSTRGIVI
ncbi:hypothetical protein GOBAR_DD02591 [Gossypium barbadense]|nr:hypothetical protein GOBAR_DD02591 [Gossypium barbadense]